MYTPPAFRVDDPERITALLAAHSFATLVTSDGDRLTASHVPLLYRPQPGRLGTLVGHVARANEHWRDFSTGREALAIFTGPHGYVSPRWLAAELVVPTWNYTAVHVYGTPVILDDSRIVRELLAATIERYESQRANPWPGNLPEAFWDKMLRAIVAFELPIDRWEAKFKLSQNRPVADRQGVVAGLLESGEPELAELVRHTLEPDAGAGSGSPG